MFVFKKFKFLKNKRFHTPILKVIKDENMRVAIIGRPNTGKSTIYNRLTGSYMAIIDNQPVFIFI